MSASASLTAPVREAWAESLRKRAEDRRRLRLVEPQMLPPGVTLNPKQQELFDAVLNSDFDSILYGGAYKGGKSFAFRLLATYLARLRPNTNILFLRRTFPQLRDNHIRLWLREMPEGWAHWNATDKTWEFPNGSVIVMGHCAHESDVGNYLGSDWDYMFTDEVTTFTEFMADAISSRLLTTKDLTPKWITGSNPGGIGHGWVKARWITRDAAERSDGTEVDLSRYLFIPAKLRDNPHVNAEEAERRLSNLPPEMRKAYLDGDWDIFAGQFFTLLPTVDGRPWHVHRASDFNIPEMWPRLLSMDYGGTAPNVVLESVYDKANDRIIFAGEDVAAGCTVPQNAERVTARWDIRRYRRVADPEIKARDQVADRSSIADQWARAGCSWEMAFNGRADGWQLMRSYMGRVCPDGLPALIILDTCPTLLRELPQQVYDPNNPEDIKQAASIPDHCCDAARYGVAAWAGRSEERRGLRRIGSVA